MRRRIALSLLILGLWPLGLAASPGAGISGFVYDAATGEAMIGANVYFRGTGVGAATNVSGYYVVPEVPAGSYTLIARYIGYDPVELPLTLAEGEHRELTFRLTARPMMMDTLVVKGDDIPTAERLFEQPVSIVDLSSRQIRELPQVAEADLQRTLQSLPGIVPLSDFSSELYVRGGTPDQNLYMIDGADIYNPEHAFGLFSTFNTEAIKKVEVSKGGFAANYGGRLSSIIDVTNLDGNREHFQGSASITLLSAKTTLQAPLGRFGSLSGSLRRTYIDQTIARAVDDIPDYYFIDGSLKAYFDLNERNKLTLSTFASRDDLRFTFNTNATDQSQIGYDWGNRSASARWTTVLAPRLFASVWIAGSRYDADLDFGDAVPFREQNEVSDLTVKAHASFYQRNNLEWELGAEQKHLELSFREDFPNGRVDILGRPRHTVAFLNGNWKPTDRWDIQTGLRWNHYRSDTAYVRWAPRGSIKYRLTPTVNVKAAGGVYHQFLHRAPRVFIADVWSYANRYQGPSKAYHAIVGVQKELGERYQLELEPYYKRYLNVFTFVDNSAVNVRPGYYDDNGSVYNNTNGLFYRGDAFTYGLDVMLRRELGVVTGWLGVGYAFTEVAYDLLNDNKSYAPRHDRRVTLNAAGNVDLKNLFRQLHGKPAVQQKSNWRLGFTLVYMSGQPITQPTSGYFIRPFPDREAAGLPFEFYPSELNNIRLPYYARLDISLTYEKHYKGWSLYPFLQIFNVGYRRNVWFLKYDLEGSEQTVEPQYMFPILPTIGVRAEF